MNPASYSRIDRLTHRIAFCHRAVQDVLAEVEAATFGRTWRDQPLARPIFVTSLPRAGTTLLLQVLSRMQSVATHTYRDMPFVRAPILWSRLAGGFRAARTAGERAHGDGVMVDFDSPEAFEETVWLARFPEHYKECGIVPWRGPVPRFMAEFADHMRRVIVLRRPGATAIVRYLSKNNANIARIGVLRSAFPDAQIVVPIRNPLDQARSMYRQHLRFASLHATDRFARRYMADIGHFEFGALHRPILFERMDSVTARYKPDQLEYWIAYWTVAYGHLAQERGVTFVDHDRFCRDGGRSFQLLCELLGLSAEPVAARMAAQQITPKRPSESVDREPDNLEEARELFHELCAQSLPVGQNRSASLLGH